MNAAHAVLVLHDIDLLRNEAAADTGTGELRRLGLALDVAALERARAKALARIDRRWLSHYERAVRRYGRAVARVRDRVCLGCFVTLPTSASPSPDESLTVCESCGRILYWR